jgi:hypothetical protein
MIVRQREDNRPAHISVIAAAPEDEPVLANLHLPWQLPGKRDEVELFTL